MPECVNLTGLIKSARLFLESFTICLTSKNLTFAFLQNHKRQTFVSHSLRVDTKHRLDMERVVSSNYIPRYAKLKQEDGFLNKQPCSGDKGSVLFTIPSCLFPLMAHMLWNGVSPRTV